MKIDVPSLSLDAAGLVALTDLAPLQARTALTGTESYLDAFVLCPGLHLQQKAQALSQGERPERGEINKGFVFRIENPATVYFLQK
jgi:hypothetical protein